jgi:pyridinium-3,5-biscarboxylic acid mononucleotide sulfurtransferase
VAELPAAPCLASRIETGIPINAADLALADEVERRVRAEFGAADVRCRIIAQGVRVELGSEALERLRSPIGGATRAAVEEIVAGLGRAFLGYAPYRRGSAFVRNTSHD